MKKKYTILLLMMFVLAGLCGCGIQKDKSVPAGNEVAISQNGAITNTIRESFEEEYYDEDSLKNFTMEEVSEYNQLAGDEKIGIKKLEVADGKVTLVMHYTSSEDFQKFNGNMFFCGTVADAYDAGNDLDISLTGTGKDAVTIGKEELLEMGSRKIVITDHAMNLKTSGKILYTGGAVNLTGSKSADTAENELSYIIYK